MKKLILISLGSILVVAGIIAGCFVTINSKDKRNTSINELAKEKGVEDDCIDEEIDLEYAISASKQEIKISPNAVLLIEKCYNQCGHTTKEYVEATNLVNKTKEEVQEIYSDWEIKHFSEKDINIIKAFEGICNEHYVVKEKDGNIAIYYLDSNEEKNLLEITEISTEYLPKEDLELLKIGVRVNGKEELNAMLEDYE